MNDSISTADSSGTTGEELQDWVPTVFAPSLSISQAWADAR